MYGMMCALLAASIWVTLATYWELGVSSTHAIIGAIVGFTLVWDGTSGVVWVRHIDIFPYYEGLWPVLLSWVLAPFITFLISAGTFLLHR